MCICCGAAFGMVLSSFPIFILIPLVAWMEEYSARLRRSHANRNQRTDHDAPTATSKSAEALRAAVNADEDSSSAGESQSDTTPLPHGRGSDPDLATASRLRRPSILRSLDPSPSRRRWLSKTATGVLLAAAVYLITNPYILINAFVNREVLQSNFSNSLAMYEIARIGEGFVRVLKLTAEGATTPILVLGTIAVMVAFWRRRFAMLPLAIPALVFFTQFVLIGAGKPAEYGRFGVFTNTALAIGTACVLGRRWTTRLRDVVNWLPVVPVVLWVATFGALYLMGFVADSGTNNTRIMLAGYMADLAEYMKHDGFPRHDKRVALLQEPAPYSCPPLPFAQRPVLLFAKHRFDQADLIRPGFTVHITPRDYVAELNQYDRQVVNPPASYFPPSTTFFVPMPLSSFVSFGGENYDPFNPPWGGSMLCGSPTPISWANKPFMNFAVWRFDSKPQDAEPRQGPPAP